MIIEQRFWNSSFHDTQTQTNKTIKTVHKYAEAQALKKRVNHIMQHKSDHNSLAMFVCNAIDHWHTDSVYEFLLSRIRIVAYYNHK